MTYIKWKDEVEGYLASLPREEKQKVFSYFSEMYADKREAGKSEEQIIEEFGAPYDVAKKILAENRDAGVRQPENYDDVFNGNGFDGGYNGGGFNRGENIFNQNAGYNGGYNDGAQQGFKEMPEKADIPPYNPPPQRKPYNAQQGQPYNPPPPQQQQQYNAQQGQPFNAPPKRQPYNGQNNAQQGQQNNAQPKRAQKDAGRTVLTVILTIVLIAFSIFLIGAPIAGIIQGFAVIGASLGGLIAGKYQTGMVLTDLGYGFLHVGLSFILLAPFSILNKFLWKKLKAFKKGN